MSKEERDVIDAAKDFILYLTMVDTGYTITTEKQEHANQICDRLNRLQANVEVIANEVRKPSPDYEKRCVIMEKALDAIAFQETERLRSMPKLRNGEMMDVTYHRIAVEALERCGKDIAEFAIGGGHE